MSFIEPSRYAETFCGQGFVANTHRKNSSWKAGYVRRIEEIKVGYHLVFLKQQEVQPAYTGGVAPGNTFNGFAAGGLQRQTMENNHFITGEPNELVAGFSTTKMQWGKLSDWQNGYGKITVAIILVYAGYSILDTGFPAITFDNWVESIFTYAKYGILFWIAFDIYKGSFEEGKNLLVINSKGILHKEKTFYWSDIASFQLSLEKDANNRYHVYYLNLMTKDRISYKIDISVYQKKADEIHHVLLVNLGRNDVKDLGFTQNI